MCGVSCWLTFLKKVKHTSIESTISYPYNDYMR